MNKRKDYIVIGVLVSLLVVLCICLTMCHGEEADNKSGEKDADQTEIILDSDNVEDESEDANSAENADERDKTGDSEKTNTDQKNPSDKTGDKQNPTLNSNGEPSNGNVYDFADVWGDDADTSSDSENGGNSGNEGEPSDSDSEEEDILDDRAQDDKNSGYGPLI